MAVQIMKKQKAASPSPAELVLKAGKSTTVKSSPKPKSKATKKAELKAKLEAELDVLKDMVHYIEKLKTAEQAYEVLHSVQKDYGVSIFYMGGLLQRINEEKWFKAKGYASFQDYVEGETDLALSTAYAYALIYVRLVHSGISWWQVEEVGWTKLRLIAKYLTQDNLEEWIDRAKISTQVELREYMKTVKNAEITPQTANPPAVSSIEETDTKGLPKDTLECTEIPESVPPVDTTLSDEEPQQMDDKPAPLTNHAAQTKHALKIFVVPEQEKLIRETIQVAKAILEMDDAGEALTTICKTYLQVVQE